MTTAEVLEKIQMGESIREADISGLDFSGQDLSEGRFFNVRASGTLFPGANLSQTFFTECDLDKAIFDNGELERTIF